MIAPAYFRRYVPIGSGREYSEFNSRVQVMIAILVPARFKDSIAYRDGIQIDAGMTMLMIYQQLHVQDEYALELGGQTYALSMEIHYAREEVLETYKAKFAMEADSCAVEVDSS